MSLTIVGIDYRPGTVEQQIEAALDDEERRVNDMLFVIDRVLDSDVK